LENLAQHCNVEMTSDMTSWRWRQIWRHRKCRLQRKTDI